MAPDPIQGCTGSGGSACSWVAAELQDWAAPWEAPFVLMGNASYLCVCVCVCVPFFLCHMHTMACK